MAGQMAIRAGRAFVELFADDSQLVRTLRRAEARIRRFGENIKSIGRQLTTFGIAAGIPFAASMKVFASFEATMSSVKAMTKGTAEEFDILTDKAKELGRTTRFTASQVAEGMKYMAMAGFDRSEIEKGIESILNLAIAGNLDLGLASDISTDISTPFGIAADEIGRVADVLAKAATSSNTSVEMMGYSFKYAAASAATTGQSLEDMAAALALLANSGQKASVAGTQLRMIMMQFSSEHVIKEMNRLGVQTADSVGNLRPILDILTELDEKTKGLGGQKQFGLFSELFGARAATGAIVLVKDVEGIAKFREEMNGAAGAAKEMAGIMADNLQGDMIKLWSAVEGVAIAVGETLAPALRKVGDYIANVLTGFAKYVSKNKQLVTTVAKVLTVVTGVGAALFILGTIITVALSPLGKTIIALSALVGAFWLIYRNASTIKNTLTSVTDAIKSVVTSLPAGFGDVFIDAFKQVGVAVDWLGEKIVSLFSIANESYGAIVAALGRVNFADFHAANFVRSHGRVSLDLYHCGHGRQKIRQSTLDNFIGHVLTWFRFACNCTAFTESRNVFEGVRDGSRN